MTRRDSIGSGSKGSFPLDTCHPPRATAYSTAVCSPYAPHPPEPHLTEPRVGDHTGLYRAGRERREVFSSVSYRTGLQNGGIILLAVDMIFMVFLIWWERKVPQSPRPQTSQCLGLWVPLEIAHSINAHWSPTASTAQGCVPLGAEDILNGQPVQCLLTCTDGKELPDLSLGVPVASVVPIAVCAGSGRCSVPPSG